MIKAIDRFGGRKTTTEKIVKKIVQAKVKLKMKLFNNLFDILKVVVVDKMVSKIF